MTTHYLPYPWSSASESLQWIDALLSDSHYLHEELTPATIRKPDFTAEEAKQDPQIEEWETKWIVDQSYRNDSIQLATFQTKDEAEEFVEAFDKKRLDHLPKIEVPDSWEGIDYRIPKESMDGHAYKATAEVEATIAGTTYRASFLGRTHELDSDRLEFSADCIQSAFNAIAEAIANDQVDHDEDGHPEDITTTYVNPPSNFSLIAGDS